MTNKKVPMRMCIGCREMKPKRELIRVVKVSEDRVCLDKTGKLNGRGAYVCNNAECMKKIRKTNGLSHAFSMTVSSEIYDSLEAQLDNGK